ncbi:beta-RFAP synthase [bacterium]|nr:beta-RFAP synthase [bacterium]
MCDIVHVQTGARLHFGLLAVAPARGRRFGGIGVMIDEPGFAITLQRAEHDQITGRTNYAARIQDTVQRLRQVWPDCPAVDVTVNAEIPPHSGLGSGTQLGLAIAAGLQRLCQQETSSAVELAAHIGRGQRSAIGVHGFDQGGWLIEAGKRDGEAISPLVARIASPNEWRWVLITPRETPGLSGSAELQAFRQMDSMPQALTAELCRLLLMECWPALQAGDFTALSEGLWEYGQQVGRFFAAVQGGVFADARMCELAHQLRTWGQQGIAQSSWGPTIAVLCRDADQAEHLVTGPLSAWSESCTIQISACRSEPALIREGRAAPCPSVLAAQ